MKECKWCHDFNGVCCNGDCPACADLCPCWHYPEICRYVELKEGGGADDEQ